MKILIILVLRKLPLSPKKRKKKSTALYSIIIEMQCFQSYNCVSNISKYLHIIMKLFPKKMKEMLTVP